MATAKDFLTGTTLTNGWLVSHKVVKTPGETGGAFSTGYIVKSDTGTEHFLKAIDFAEALRATDPARVLQQLTEAFNLERDILEIGKRMSHVVTIIDGGTVQITMPGSAPGTAPEPVQYLILELAQESLSQMAAASRRLPMSSALAALHNVANGLRQLNGQHIAHQDMKPSNALKFSDQQFKVCDVGRASVRGRAAPHDAFEVPGDPTYAPPELIYGQVDPEFVVRRFGCDAYLLGSLATFLVVAVPMTALIIDELDPTARPGAWAGTYAAVLPQVRAAYTRALDRVALQIPGDASYRDELILAIRQLCDPDPAQRGHPVTRAQLANVGNVYDLERYVSIFNRLSHDAKIHERRRAI